MTKTPEESPREKTSSASVSPRAKGNAWSFSLRTLFILMFLCALVMALWVEVPALGLVATVLLVPALFRTIVITQKRSVRTGTPAHFSDKIRLLGASVFLSVIMIVMVSAASWAAFWGVCMATSFVQFHNNDAKLPISIIAAIVVAIFVLIFCSKTLFADRRLSESPPFIKNRRTLLICFHLLVPIVLCAIFIISGNDFMGLLFSYSPGDRRYFSFNDPRNTIVTVPLSVALTFCLSIFCFGLQEAKSMRTWITLAVSIALLIICLMLFPNFFFNTKLF